MEVAVSPDQSSGQSRGQPRHVAIIMDGNGRWAKSRGLPRAAGHRSGADAVRRTVEAARELGLDYLTLYAFSSENWKRPLGEITDLMGLLRLYLRNEIASLHRNGIRFLVIGDRSRLSADINALIVEVETLTQANQSMTLVLALSYGGRQEIIESAKKLARKVEAGTLKPDDINEQMFGCGLYTGDIPDPDLIIRTSGEKRISNFLLWQSAYSEFVFLDVLWPDFGMAEIKWAMDEFLRRERRYGA
jgi:undecaprenyl diphosphate synthase